MKLLRRHRVPIAAMAGGGCLLAMAALFSPGAELRWLLPTLRWCGVACFLGYAAHRRSLTAWIFAAMVAGYACGVDLPRAAVHLNVLSIIFIRLIRTIIAPLIFSTLVLGIAGHSNFRQLGRMAVRALVYFELVSTVALFIGLGAIHLTHAGEGAVRPPATAHAIAAPAAPHGGNALAQMVPENIAEAVAENNVLQIVIFSILFAGAVAMLEESRKAPILRLCRSLSEAMFLYTKIVMWFAPLGVGGAIAYATGSMGLGIFGNLLRLLLTLYGALAAFVLLVLLPIALLARVPMRRFARACSEPAMIAFATSASEAALPRAMECMEALGVPAEMVAFVLPLGYSFNLDGSTLYLSLASVFVAQAAGIAMSFPQELLMVATLMLASKGVAGVSRGTFVVLLGTLSSFHLPEWPLVMILSIDALMDMGRTSLNVVGNCLASVLIAIWAGKFQLSPEAALAGDGQLSAASVTASSEDPELRPSSR